MLERTRRALTRWRRLGRRLQLRLGRRVRPEPVLLRARQRSVLPDGPERRQAAGSGDAVGGGGSGGRVWPPCPDSREADERVQPIQAQRFGTASSPRT